MQELRVIENTQKLVWTFDESKQYLEKQIKQYENLVVSATNLAEMEKTQREVASLRTKLNKFRLAVKKDLDKPYDKFKSQVDELLGLVADVELPIKDQIEKYELQRRKDKKEEIQQFIDKACEELKLFDKFRDQIVIDDRWMNRGQKIKDTQDEVYIKIGWLLDIQNKEIDAENFRLQKIEMAKFMCESLSKGLATPLTFAEIEHRLESFDIASMKSYIETEIASRKEREDRAAQAAIERAEQERLAEVARQEKAEQAAAQKAQAAIEAAERARIEAERQATLQQERDERARQQAQFERNQGASGSKLQNREEHLEKLVVANKIPDKPVKQESKLHNAQFVLYKVTMEEIETIKVALKDSNIEFKYAVKEAK